MTTCASWVKCSLCPYVNTNPTYHCTHALRIRMLQSNEVKRKTFQQLKDAPIQNLITWCRNIPGQKNCKEIEQRYQELQVTYVIQLLEGNFP
jgi:alpha-D-ribose 1-methylphosphonate 5-triphosphate diphosphatase PhnM